MRFDIAGNKDARNRLRSEQPIVKCAALEIGGDARSAAPGLLLIYVRILVAQVAPRLIAPEG